MQPLVGYIGMPGPFELLIIAVIVLLLFGKRLPSVMGSLGRSVVEFKKGISGVEDEVDKAKDEIDKAVSGKIERDPAKR
jgi:sec-independent protein translocase protein TatA